jgi:NUMOD3 motif
MFYTYAHTKPDGTIFYIGKGKDKRAWSKNGRSTHWKNIVAKYKNYDIQILANWDTEQEAFDHEILLISCFKDMGYKLINLTAGGDGPSGYKWTEEQKANRIWRGVTGKQNGWFGKGYLQTGENHPFFGKHHTEKTKNKLSKIKVGLYDGDKHPQFKGTIEATNIKTGEKTFYNGNAELTAVGFQFQNVSKCINGKRKTHKGHTFKRIEK